MTPLTYQQVWDNAMQANRKNPMPDNKPLVVGHHTRAISVTLIVCAGGYVALCCLMLWK